MENLRQGVAIRIFPTYNGLGKFSFHGVETMIFEEQEVEEFYTDEEYYEWFTQTLNKMRNENDEFLDWLNNLDE